jgi:hypothetical protein
LNGFIPLVKDILISGLFADAHSVKNIVKAKLRFSPKIHDIISRINRIQNVFCKIS